ncbi:hypothetical protein [Actinacidiphila sp. DG2A-62]|uniref:hypothetical protein n=1 Tax=Actinacidiphila sp. DG2A-62 TaxID=3108821 RepID=UPI003FA377B0
MLDLVGGVGQSGDLRQRRPPPGPGGRGARAGRPGGGGRAPARPVGRRGGRGRRVPARGVRLDGRLAALPRARRAGRRRGRGLDPAPRRHRRFGGPQRPGRPDAAGGHGGSGGRRPEAGATFSGPASDLLLALYRRVPWDEGALRVDGDRELVRQLVVWPPLG